LVYCIKKNLATLVAKHLKLNKTIFLMCVRHRQTNM
jgi:hypothetical protein